MRRIRRRNGERVKLPSQTEMSFLSIFSYFLTIAKPYSVSPAPTTRYWVPSSS